ncbi:hypothetical protein, partial [Salmonella enterica]|uniref:hypothetical protein n=1 Tax=Salmonella enterica TaxID=28901 RepID=UPI0019D582B6
MVQRFLNIVNCIGYTTQLQRLIVPTDLTAFKPLVAMMKEKLKEFDIKRCELEIKWDSTPRPIMLNIKLPDGIPLRSTFGSLVSFETRHVLKRRSVSHVSHPVSRDDLPPPLKRSSVEPRTSKNQQLRSQAVATPKSK